LSSPPRRSWTARCCWRLARRAANVVDDGADGRAARRRWGGWHGMRLALLAAGAEDDNAWSGSRASFFCLFCYKMENLPQTNKTHIAN
jgi:hypothetical protein